jgi:hypothetical protein
LCCLAVYGPNPTIAAPDCPNESTARDNFIVERDRRITEVVTAGNRLIRTIYRSTAGESLVETTTFEGLFELEQINRGHRTIFHPITKLDRLFPLKVGRELIAIFESSGASQIARTQIALRVVRADSLFIESCKYSVLVIDRRIGQGGAAPVFTETDYYSPELKLIIAKEYKNPNGTSFLAKFDKIYVEKH